LWWWELACRWVRVFPAIFSLSVVVFKGLVVAFVKRLEFRELKGFVIRLVRVVIGRI
jgi:hypothetical protein